MFKLTKQLYHVKEWTNVSTCPCYVDLAGGSWMHCWKALLLACFIQLTEQQAKEGLSMWFFHLWHICFNTLRLLLMPTLLLLFCSLLHSPWQYTLLYFSHFYTGHCYLDWMQKFWHEGEPSDKQKRSPSVESIFLKLCLWASTLIP